MDTKLNTSGRTGARAAEPHTAPEIEGVTNGKLDPALVPDGPTYTIPEWAGMAVGDFVQWYWLGTSAGGQDMGELTVETVGDVVATVARGVVEINANGGDKVTAVYAVTPEGGTREESAATVFDVLPLAGGETLPPPTVLEADEGGLDPDNIGIDITVFVDVYDGMIDGDNVWVYFGQGTDGEHSEHFMVSDKVVGKPVEMYVPKAKVERLDGTSVTVYYEVMRAAGSTDVSQDLVLWVGEPIAGPRWPAPYVEEADGDYLPDGAYPRGVRTVVPLHDDMQVGDVIHLYWGSGEREYTDSVNITQLRDFSFRVDKDIVDRWYGEVVAVRYTLTHGTSVIHSEVLHLGVAVEPAGLPPPEMSEVVNGILNVSDLARDTDVTVPVYEGMASGDVIYIDWGPGAGNGGLTLLDQVTEGMVGRPVTAYFETDAIAPFVGETIPVSYRIEGTSVNAKSDDLLVTVVRESATLSPPDIPAVKGGMLDPRQVSNGVEVVVPYSRQYMQQGYLIRLTWRCSNDDADYTTSKPVGGGTNDILFTVPFATIEAGIDGTVTVSYEVLVGEDVVASGAADAFTIYQAPLPAVVLVEAVGSNLNPDHIPPEGATVDIGESAMFALDDIVTVHWKGVTDYSIPPYTIKSADVGNAIELLLPKATVNASNGTVVSVTYEVLRKASQLTETSPPSTYDVGRELARGDLIVLGARNADSDYRNAGASRYLRAVEAATRSDIVVEWRYEGDTASESGSSFFDREPWRLLHVRTEDASLSVLPLHVAGSGVDSVLATGAAAYGALFATSGPYAWGQAAHGGEIDSSFMGFDAAEVSATQHALVARLSDGRALAWGNPTNGGSVSPFPTNVARIVGNVGAFAYIRRDGTLGAWGNPGTAGVVTGDAATVNDAASIIPCSQAFCCMRANGQLVAWGEAAHGGVIPPLFDGEAFVSVRGGMYTFCALRPDGGLIAWGSEANGGKLSDEAAVARNIAEIAASTHGAFAVITTERKVMAWGREPYGGEVPEAIELIDDIVEVVANTKVFCARRANGKVVTWGGTAPTDNHGYPLPNELALEEFIQVTASSTAFAGLKRDGTVLTWGDPARGGDSSAVQAKLVDIRAVYANSQGFTAIPARGGAVTWGVAAGGGSPTLIQQNLLDQNLRYDAEGSAVAAASPQGAALAAYRLRKARAAKA
ncbi:RCC1 domain-containing protein [Pandoraea oxalativorans]|nr:hypothetical protein [Pandoraea oxalativorans]